MSKISQPQKIVNFLQANPLKRFGVREIAAAIVEKYSDDYREKRKNPRFADDKAFMAQIVAEVGASKENILKISPHISCQDKPRPCVYWYDPNVTLLQETVDNSSDENEDTLSFHVLSNRTDSRQRLE